MPPRCCEPPANEFEPSYASVLAFGAGPGLKDAVHALERDECITSCFTAWCPRCRSNYLLATDLQSFPSPSAHHTHQLRLLAMLRAHGIYPPANGQKPGAAGGI